MSDDRLLMTRRQCCLGAMALLAAGCSTGESRPSLISEKKERELGQEATGEVERTVGLVQDPALVGYVRAIGQRLVAHTSTPAASAVRTLSSKRRLAGSCERSLWRTTMRVDAPLSAAPGRGAAGLAPGAADARRASARALAPTARTLFRATKDNLPK